MPRRVPLTVLLLALLLAPGLARGWSGFVHELVAELAERQLSASARAGALDLLAGEADHLAEVAAWADQVRDQPGYRWSAPLHYVNFPRGQCDYQPARDCAGGSCVVAALERFRGELADEGLPRVRRAEALKFLIHLVADIHQPLHCGSQHDRGGNTHQLNVEGEGSNLHRVWDYSMLARGGRDRDQHLAALSAQPLPAAGPFDPVGWALDSCALVQVEGFYPARRRLPAAYFERYVPVAEARVRLAAARLAALLERQFGKAP